MYRRLRDLREYNDYSQEYLAKYLSCSQSSNSKIEAGKRQLPTDYLIKFVNLILLKTPLHPQHRHNQRYQKWAYFYHC